MIQLIPRGYWWNCSDILNFKKPTVSPFSRTKVLELSAFLGKWKKKRKLLLWVSWNIFERLIVLFPNVCFTNIYHSCLHKHELVYACASKDPLVSAQFSWGPSLKKRLTRTKYQTIWNSDIWCLKVLKRLIATLWYQTFGRQTLKYLGSR